MFHQLTAFCSEECRASHCEILKLTLLVREPEGVVTTTGPGHRLI